MRNYFTIALFAGFGLINSISTSAQAVTLIQEFEIVVDDISLVSPSTPPIGTRGQGRLTFDTNLIQFNPGSPFSDPYREPVGYFVRQPTRFSLDFFNNRYTNLPRGTTIVRSAPIFFFDRTESGSYQLVSFNFGKPTLA